ncbi:MAG TPA: 5-amino-6-(D-ribitylamino)uracil--L-tyrosine 4-hydroxyphenyl transferase CofH [Candidatus Methanofastidiosa archaeon]|nr:5-amino-6-(D-ribitylamino)uracil--L-tyrosine 4-hydroxyphenyl transferase CofH [Candidatus Methanofastidiosa archaeon]HPR41862.1 5-amino-6-(D-ribitylamino)uracil--L-tyrosine 4-hydroxyphenyl transferase CofH [Candidatus Methanofastidiosa archaeon]
MLELDPVIEDILLKSLSGKEIGREQAIELMGAIDKEYHALCYVANELRRESVGDIVTYVQNRNIYSTNICTSTCKFCSFRSDNGYVVEVGDILEKCATPGITEICMQGGLNPELGADYFIGLIDSIKERYPNLHIHAFSPAEVDHMAAVSGVGHKEVLGRLKEAGLGSMPGTAAEVLDDDVRSVICPDKIKTARWVEIIKDAHKIGIPTTSTIMYGHVESIENRVDHLLTLRDIQKETGGFTEFIPLSFIPGNSLGEDYGIMGASGADDVRMIAVSRLLFNGLIDNIQTAWVKFGRKFAQTMLLCGANDLGGTLYQESISKASGGIHGEYISVEQLRNMTEPLNRTLRQRDTLYNLFEG